MWPGRTRAGRKVAFGFPHIIDRVTPEAPAQPGRRCAPRRALLRRLAARLAVGLAVVGLAAGCGGAAFDPSGPCVADGRAAGAYPDLEALLPTRYAERPPDRVDSGRNCSAQALGTLASRGVEELRFAGATWDLGGSNGVTMAVLAADGLEADWVAEFYEAGARAGRRVEEVTVAALDLGGVPGTWIDVLNGESFQSVVVAPLEPDRVRVVLVASAIREIETRDAHKNRVFGALTFWFPGSCCN